MNRFAEAARSSDSLTILSWIITNEDQFVNMLNITHSYEQDTHEHNTLWEILFALVEENITILANTIERDDMTNNATSILSKIVIVVNIYVKRYFGQTINRSIPPNLFQTIASLNNILLFDEAGRLQTDSNAHLKHDISEICEYWWNQKEAGAELLIAQLIPYLLINCIDHANSGFIKRVFALREGIHLFDFDDSSIESLRDLLLRCVVSPKFLRASEGRKFLSFLFSVHEDLTRSIIEVMRRQIALGMRSVCRAYGDIILSAWKDAVALGSRDAQCKETIEDIIQSFIHNAVHAADPKYALGLRTLLGVIHEAKRQTDVDTMLLRSYNPIIWRSLSCANAKVRARAVALFLEAFPLQSPELSAAEAETLLQKQFSLFLVLLKDSHPGVRVAAVSGVSYALCAFWEMIPSCTVVEVLDFLVDFLAVDSSSTLVRRAVFQGLSVVFDNPMAHDALRTVLPRLRQSLNDKSEKVRILFTKMLAKAQDVRCMQAEGGHLAVVSSDALLNRLVVDGCRPGPASALTSLLMDEYYPRSSTGHPMGPVQVGRCLQFLQRNESAALVFYGTFYLHSSVGSAAKLAVMLHSLLSKVLRQAQKSDTENKDAFVSADILSQTAKLSIRSKRPRQDLAMGVDDVNEDTNMPPSLRRSVLRAILSTISGIRLLLHQPSHSPSLELLAEHFTPRAVTGLLENLSGLQLGQQASTPIETTAFELLAVLFDVLPVLRDECWLTSSFAANGADDDDSKPSSEPRSTLSHILELVSCVWASCECPAALRRNALSLLELMSSSGNKSLLWQLILSPRNFHSNTVVGAESSVGLPPTTCVFLLAVLLTLPSNARASPWPNCRRLQAQLIHDNEVKGYMSEVLANFQSLAEIKLSEAASGNLIDDENSPNNLQFLSTALGLWAQFMFLRLGRSITQDADTEVLCEVMEALEWALQLNISILSHFGLPSPPQPTDDQLVFVMQLAMDVLTVDLLLVCDSLTTLTNTPETLFSPVSSRAQVVRNSLLEWLENVVGIFIPESVTIFARFVPVFSRVVLLLAKIKTRSNSWANLLEKLSKDISLTESDAAVARVESLLTALLTKNEMDPDSLDHVRKTSVMLFFPYILRGHAKFTSVLSRYVPYHTARALCDRLPHLVRPTAVAHPVEVADANNDALITAENAALLLLTLSRSCSISDREELRRALDGVICKVDLNSEGGGGASTTTYTLLKEISSYLD